MQCFISVLFLGASGCSIATLSQASQPTATSTHLSTKITPEKFTTKTVKGLSKQVVSIKANNLMQSLDYYQWKNRLLLVFAHSENQAEYQQQMQLFQRQDASFGERNLLIIELFAQGTSRVGSESLDAQETAKIRDRFNVSPDQFCVVLVGKDGTAKRRDNFPVSSKVIFETIDAMPMRRQEMRDNSN